jgi:S-adenosylmethionine:tRNA ribosyltransferase-isomerase
MTDSSILPALKFSLPPELEASEPPEARGLQRDQVRLMVSNYSTDTVRHASFYDLPEFLTQGDLIVINTSRTRNSALMGTRADGTLVELHLSTHLADDLWTVEVRSLNEIGKTKHLDDARIGEILSLPDAASATLLGPYNSDCSDNLTPSETVWQANVNLPLSLSLESYLARHGFPIRYNYVKDRWPLPYYQTVYATETGSAEMPSAGRPFTLELLNKLESKGVRIAPLILHTGISNLESHEPPYKEFYRVSSETADLVNKAQRTGKRIVAVGTTVIRALETVTNADGTTHAGEGWTCLVISPKRRLRTANALLTGMHEPEASHLAILETLAGLPHVKAAYDAALQEGYLWHEFGDLHLILP